MASLRDLADQKITELKATIELHDFGKRDEALALVNQNIGKNIMERIRASIDELRSQEQQRIDAEDLASRNLKETCCAPANSVAVLLTILVGFFSMKACEGNWTRSLPRTMISGRLIRPLWRSPNSEANLAEQLRQSQKMEAIGQLTGGLAKLAFQYTLSVIVGSISLAKRSMQKADGTSATLPRLRR